MVLGNPKPVIPPFLCLLRQLDGVLKGFRFCFGIYKDMFLIRSWRTPGYFRSVGLKERKT